MPITPEKIEEIIDRIVETVHPHRIYLFGSWARGTAGKDSDIDLLVIADMEGSRRERNLSIRELFPMRDFSMDVFVLEPEEFERQKTVANTISSIVSKEGKILYEEQSSATGGTGTLPVLSGKMSDPPGHNSLDDEKDRMVFSWFKKGDNDLRAAELILRSDAPPLDVVCFHAQQCIEKYLKGFLTFHQIEVRRTHDLGDLLTECGNVVPSFAKWEKDCERLTDYAVEARYPERFYEHSMEEAEEAVSVATRLKEFVRTKIGPDDFDEDDLGRTA